jgi:hypothetical protein
MTQCLLNTTSDRLLGICDLLSQPLQAHHDIKCIVTQDKREIYLEHKTWGSLVTLEISDLPSSQSLLTIRFPESPDLFETQQYQTALLIQLADQVNIRRLVGFDAQEKQLLFRLSHELLQIRMEYRGHALDWLFDNLRIWGIEVLDQPRRITPQTRLWSRLGKKLGLLSSPGTNFDFFIKGSPAEFGIMARELIIDAIPLRCTILQPGTRRKILEIPVDVNPISIHYKTKWASLEIVAHKLLNGNTVLKVTLPDNLQGWGLWDSIRDEIERMGWFSIFTTNHTQSQLLPDEKIFKKEYIMPPSPQNDAMVTIHNNEELSDEVPQLWLTIPDRGWDRECVRLWHRGLTCKDIGRRLKKTDKTILNRLNQIRKEYGEQIVPYRCINNYRSG